MMCYSHMLTHTHIHTQSWTQNMVKKNMVQFIRTQSPWKCQTLPAGSRKLCVCVCVCQSASLSTCLCICVWVCLKEPGVTEKSGFFFNNRGLKFPSVALTVYSPTSWTCWTFSTGCKWSCFAKHYFINFGKNYTLVQFSPDKMVKLIDWLLTHYSFMQ